VLRVVRLVWLALGDHEHVAMASWPMPPGRQIHPLEQAHYRGRDLSLVSLLLALHNRIRRGRQPPVPIT